MAGLLVLPDYAARYYLVVPRQRIQGGVVTNTAEWIGLRGDLDMALGRFMRLECNSRAEAATLVQGGDLVGIEFTLTFAGQGVISLGLWGLQQRDWQAS